MMGTQDAPAQLFYDFDLEQHVPAEHMLCEIDRCLDMDGMQEALRPFYSSLGRPSIDPELIIMLVIGYVMGIRSERRLCDEAHLNLAYRWFWRLDLEGKVLDHSTFSRYRQGKLRDSDLLRKVFEDEPSTPLMADKVSLSSPFRQPNTILIFSSAEYCLRGRSRDVFGQQLCGVSAALKE